MYDDKNRIIFTSTYEKDETKFRQKGLYEEMLCPDCESTFSRYELYVRKLFYEEMDYQQTDIENQIKVINIDYTKFKLFQLSVIWRASVSKNLFFSKVTLGPHEERIRKMLLKENPGDSHEYGCIITGLIFEKGEAFDAIISPETGRLNGDFRAYRFVFGGCLWVYIVASHSKYFERKEYFLTKEGTTLFRILKATQVPFLGKFMEELARATQT